MGKQNNLFFFLLVSCLRSSFDTICDFTACCGTNAVNTRAGAFICRGGGLGFMHLCVVIPNNSCDSNNTLTACVQHGDGN